MKSRIYTTIDSTMSEDEIRERRRYRVYQIVHQYNGRQAIDDKPGRITAELLFPIYGKCRTCSLGDGLGHGFTFQCANCQHNSDGIGGQDNWWPSEPALRGEEQKCIKAIESE